MIEVELPTGPPARWFAASPRACPPSPRSRSWTFPTSGTPPPLTCWAPARAGSRAAAPGWSPSPIPASSSGPGTGSPSSTAAPARSLTGSNGRSPSGTFSPRGSHKPGYELTLIAAEVVEELTARDARLHFASTRRNVLTRDIDVNALVEREFTIGGVRCRGLRLAEPCAHLERLAGPGLLRPLIHRGGLRADILNDGTLTAGTTIST